MARNYPKEARLSKINAESIIRRAMWVTLLYSLASGLLLSLVYLFAMELVEFHGFVKVAENEATHKLVMMQAFDALMNMLNGGEADLVGILGVLAFPVLVILIALIKCISIIAKTGDVEHSIANPHLKAYKEHFRRKRAVCRKYIKAARKMKDRARINASKRRLREVKQKAREIKRYYRFNRYAKNEQTETVYRYWTRRAERNSKIFFIGFRLIVTAFFAFMLVTSTGLIKYVENLAEFDAKNPQKPLPTVFEALTPTIEFGENAQDTLYLNLVYIALIIGIVFQFITAPLGGSVTRVKLADHEITYMHMKGSGWLEQMDYNHSYYNFYPNHAGEIFPYLASGYESRPRRWDESDAILEERPREVRVVLFFFRNLSQVFFCLVIVGLFVYLFPALEQIEKIEQRAIMGISFEYVFLVLKWGMILSMVSLIWYVLSSKEYVFDSLHEETERRRGKYVGKLVILLILLAVYLLLLHIPEFIEGGHSIKYLFETSIPTDGKAGDFLLVFNGIVTTFIVSLIVVVGAICVDVALRPRERKKIKDGDDFFAINRSWRNIPMEDDE
ncbi:MAG: hypothetical protein J6D30_00005 [Clostridia bacterium]|nr:hypothetical protein [Clostridia bacterium]